MDLTCLDHLLTEEEAQQFEEEGFFVLPECLTDDEVDRLEEVTDRLDAERRPAAERASNQTQNSFDFLGYDEAYLDLIDYPKTFPKVFGILGWNIQIYHTHCITTPPEGPDNPRQRYGWHQDSGRLNRELEGEPRARVSIKCAYFLTDVSEIGRGNFCAVPGSHRYNRIQKPDGQDLPDRAVHICVPRGGAVFFDRRIWHCGSPNRWNQTRKALFYGYSYRWLKFRDEMTIEKYLDDADPIRRQLLGAPGPSGWHGFTSPKDEDVPLKGWIAEHVGDEAAIA
ncbi:phytanoyl-CoA dioxygenase family protein [bacterium]|nr:phytanoyl-CoA dioxygenase family protein [bacterium]